MVLDTTYDPPLPVPLKIGDLNLDGFVDIVPIVATPYAGDRSKLKKTPKILGSVPCKKGVAGCGPDGQGRRGWSVLGRDNNVLEEFRDARGVVLVDIDEDVSPNSFDYPMISEALTGNFGYHGATYWGTRAREHLVRPE